MVLVVIYLAIAFEWRMALAALVALIHDITITVGIYALVGFEVTPGTVIGLLTILGYSLYDTVVVFDGLKEAARRTSPSRPAAPTARSPTAASTAPWCVPSTPRWSRCCRSPACCSSAAAVLGAGMLNDISLSLFVGLAAGAYSSIFIATPLVADLKEREPQMKALKKRVCAKRAAGAPPRASRRGRGRPTQDEPYDDEPGATPRRAGSSGRAASPPSRSRGRGRPSGKRR